MKVLRLCRTAVKMGTTCRQMVGAAVAGFQHLRLRKFPDRVLKAYSLWSFRCTAEVVGCTVLAASNFTWYVCRSDQALSTAQGVYKMRAFCWVSAISPGDAWTKRWQRRLYVAILLYPTTHGIS